MLTAFRQQTQRSLANSLPELTAPKTASHFLFQPSWKKQVRKFWSCWKIFLSFLNIFFHSTLPLDILTICGRLYTLSYVKWLTRIFPKWGAFPFMNRSSGESFVFGARVSVEMRKPPACLVSVCVFECMDQCVCVCVGTFLCMRLSWMRVWPLCCRFTTLKHISSLGSRLCTY